jgi:hypothetical protein
MIPRLLHATTQPLDIKCKHKNSRGLWNHSVMTVHLAPLIGFASCWRREALAPARSLDLGQNNRDDEEGDNSCLTAESNRRTAHRHPFDLEVHHGEATYGR